MNRTVTRLFGFFIAITETYLTISGTACPSGYSNVGTADTCLVVTPSGTCFIYAPANTDFTDNNGSIYQYMSIDVTMRIHPPCADLDWICDNALQTVTCPQSWRFPRNHGTDFT